MNINEIDWTKLGQGIGAVMVVILGALGIRRRNSVVGRENAQDAAKAAQARQEESIFDNTVQALEKSRDEWQALYMKETERLRGLLEDARSTGRTEVERVRVEGHARLEAERAEYSSHLEQERKVHGDLTKQIVAKDQIILGLEAEKRHRLSSSRMRVLMMKRRHPEITDWDMLDSEPAPLDAP